MKFIFALLFFFCSSSFVISQCVNDDKYLNASAVCNHDVLCSIGEDWDHYKAHNMKSVARMLVPLNSDPQNSEHYAVIGTGALINNTANDGTFYFLTARHIVLAHGLQPFPHQFKRVENWRFVFDWMSQNPACGEEGISNPLPAKIVICGAEILAMDSSTDLALLKLTGEVDPEWDLVWSGWDHTDNPPTMNVGIHHAGGDVKKVCRDDTGAKYAPVLNNPLLQQGWNISKAPGDDGWEIGMVQSGSSGSPLFNEDGRIIGALAGGGGDNTNCEDVNNKGGLYGRFGVGWEEGNFHLWLDSLGTGDSTINSYPPLTPPAPTGIFCTRNFNDVIFQWNDIPGVESFTIFPEPNGCCLVFGPGNNPSLPETTVFTNSVALSDLNVGSFKCLSLRIKATYSNGQSSAFSAPFCYDANTNCFGLQFREEINSEAIQEKARAISIFPNPSSGAFHIDLKSKGEEAFNLSIYNAQGMLIKRMENNELQDGKLLMQMNTTNELATGIYLFSFEFSGTTMVEKVMIE